MEVFSNAGYTVPEVRLIDYNACLPKLVEEDSKSSGSSGSSGSNGSGGGEKKRDRKGQGKKKISNEELSIQGRIKKAVRKYCDELNCTNPNIEKAAFMYAQELRINGVESVDAGSSILLDCVVIAEKFFDTLDRDLNELEEDEDGDYPSFKNWNVEAYRMNEGSIFMTMDYCLYLKGEYVDTEGSKKSGGKKKKAKT